MAPALPAPRFASSAPIDRGWLLLGSTGKLSGDSHDAPSRIRSVADNADRRPGRTDAGTFCRHGAGGGPSAGERSPTARRTAEKMAHVCPARVCGVRTCGSSGTVAVLPGGFASSGGIQSSIEPDVRRCVERMLALQAGIRLDTSSGQGPAPAGSRHDQCPGYAAITLATLTWPGGRIVVG